MRHQKSTYQETYHIVNRGVNNMIIFRNDDDKNEYLRLIERASKKNNINVIAYCLMDNHYHLCISSVEWDYDDITKFCRYINSQYVMYFNKTSERDKDGYLRSGTIYGSSYKSVPVNSKFQLERIVAYIHNNPTPLGVDKETYEYSSYHRYINVLSTRNTLEKENAKGVVLSIESFLNYTEEELRKTTDESSKYKFEEGKKNYIGKNYITDKLLMDEVEEIHGVSAEKINNLGKDEKARILYEISVMAGVSRRQMERVFLIEYYQLCAIIRKYRERLIEELNKKENVIIKAEKRIQETEEVANIKANKREVLYRDT